MSYYWTPVCASCSEDGPKIRSGHSGLKFGPDHATSTDLLKQWLDQHEHHDVRLRGEGVLAQESRNEFPQIRLHDVGPVIISSLGAAPLGGTRQIICNRGAKPLVIREGEGTAHENRFVFPAGVTEMIVPPHGTATFVADKPTRWQRLWCRLTGRAPSLRWRYQPWDQETSKEEGR